MYGIGRVGAIWGIYVWVCAIGLCVWTGSGPVWERGGGCREPLCATECVLFILTLGQPDLLVG